MRWEGTRSNEPPGRSAQTLQGVIDRVAEQSAGQPISMVRRQVVKALRDNGFTPPSESWVDSVAREAVHGRAYAVSMETLVGHDLSTAQDKQLEDAPAVLPVASLTTPAAPVSPLPATAVEVPSRDVRSTRPTAWLLLALAGAVLVIVGYRRSHGARHTSEDADG